MTDTDRIVHSRSTLARYTLMLNGGTIPADVPGELRIIANEIAKIEDIAARNPAKAVSLARLKADWEKLADRMGN